MKFIVSRKRWATGRDAGKLMHGDRKMCCLGFCMRQLGAKAKDIQGLAMPSDLNWPEETPFTKMVNLPWDDGDTELSEKASNINDDPELTNPEREKRLRKLFKEYGHTIVFRP